MYALCKRRYKNHRGERRMYFQKLPGDVFTPLLAVTHYEHSEWKAFRVLFPSTTENGKATALPVISIANAFFDYAIKRLGTGIDFQKKRLRCHPSVSLLLNLKVTVWLQHYLFTSGVACAELKQ
jgi:hypothetical protein